MLSRQSSVVSGLTAGYSVFLGAIERTDHDVVPVRITERKLFSSCVGVHLRLLFKSSHEGAGSRQRLFEIIYPEKQK